MKLYLTSAYDLHPGLDTLLVAAETERELRHTLCASADVAEAIIFIENTQFDDLLFKRLRTHPLIAQYPGKVFMYNEMDRPWDVMPGVYTCMPKKHLNTARHRAFPYLSTPNQYIRNIHRNPPERRWLYSFMGAMSHACRRIVMRLPEHEACLRDTSDFNVWNTSADEMDKRSREYADVLGSSHFVLCPRGIGTSSIRLYEALEAGRAPVIISDQWVPPDGTDWRFALQVQENRIHTLPGLLKSLQDEALQRGQAARDAWLASYSPESLFNTLGDAIESIMRQNEYLTQSRSLPWNKWMASGGLITRTAVQKLRGQR